MKSGKKAKKTPLEERVEDFGEEVEMLGKRLGREAETHGKRIEREIHSSLGFLWPLVSSLLGAIVLALAAWLLDFAAEETGIAFLLGIRLFLVGNLGLFFLLFLVFGYADYFSRYSPRAYRPFAPIVKAAGITVAVWILANAAILSGLDFGSPSIQAVARFALARLFWVFGFLAVLGYFVLILSKKPEREAVKMAQTKTAGKPGVKKLYRSGRDKILGGVCGGIAEYFDVDPVLVRLLWVFGTLISLGTGILLYIIAWIIMPRNPNHKWG